MSQMLAFFERCCFYSYELFSQLSMKISHLTARASKELTSVPLIAAHQHIYQKYFQYHYPTCVNRLKLSALVGSGFFIKTKKNWWKFHFNLMDFSRNELVFTLKMDLHKNKGKFTSIWRIFSRSGIVFMLEMDVNSIHVFWHWIYWPDLMALLMKIWWKLR